jgi:hypothetical protein
VVIGGRIFVRWSPKTSGAAWDNGSLVNPDGYPGDTSIGFGPLLTGTYMAKLWNGGNFSVTEATFVVTEALITGLTTLATVTESPAFTGAKSNVAAVDGGIQLDGTTLIDSMLTNIDTWGAIDSLGGVRARAATASPASWISARSRRRGSSRRSTRSAFDRRPDRQPHRQHRRLGPGRRRPDRGRRGAALVRHTDDDPAGAPPGAPGSALGHVADYNFRGFEFRLDFATGSPTHNRQVSALSVTAKH